MARLSQRIRSFIDIAYAQVQKHAWLKRLAVRVLMAFPGLGGRILAQVGVPAHVRAGSAADDGPFDPNARARYLRYGYRALLAGVDPAAQPRHQLLVDVSGLLQRDAGTGIQRVVRNLTRALAELDLPDWRVEPIQVSRGRFRYARQYSTRAWQLPNMRLEDEPVEIAPGDVFFTADLALLPIRDMRRPLRAWRRQGVAVHFVLHDLIPVLHPEFYQGVVDPRFARWLDIVLEVADSIQCVSRAVSDDLRHWLATQPRVPRPDGGPQIGWFHLGARLEQARVAPEDLEAVMCTAAVRHAWLLAPEEPVFLMVGTLEPRKGHEQVLDAMERLWEEGARVHLLIIGKTGWNVSALVDRLRRHPEAGHRLHWLEGASDAELQLAYRHCKALIAASYAEGFGLPLIEAAQHGLPIIARDLPVFREVAGAYAWYFRADEPGALARALREWLALDAQGRAPGSAGMPWLTWTESAAMLARAILPPG